MPWLVRDEKVLAALEVADSFRARSRGLLGRDGIDGAFVLRPARQVHTFGMRFPIDVAFCAEEGKVVHVVSMRPGRVSRLVWTARFVIEAAAGSFKAWGLERSMTVAVRESAIDE